MIDTPDPKKTAVVAQPQQRAPLLRKGPAHRYLRNPILNWLIRGSFESEQQRTEAETGYIKAVDELAKAKVNTAISVDRLRDLPTILDTEQANRERTKTEALAALERARAAHAKAESHRMYQEQAGPKINQQKIAAIDAKNWDELGSVKRAEAAYTRLWGADAEPDMATRQPKDPEAAATTQHALAIAEDQLNKAKARNATHAEITALEGMIARYKAELYDLQQKSQPE